MSCQKLLITALIGTAALAGCKETKCPRCQVPKCFPEVLCPGKCVADTTDSTCPKYEQREDGSVAAVKSLTTTTLCLANQEGTQAIGVWTSRPMYFMGLMNQELILRNGGGEPSLCADLDPALSKSTYVTLSKPVRIRAQSWGYSAELGRYWVVGKILDSKNASENDH
jgi:hypothetical protein